MILGGLGGNRYYRGGVRDEVKLINQMQTKPSIKASSNTVNADDIGDEEIQAWINFKHSYGDSDCPALNLFCRRVQSGKAAESPGTAVAESRHGGRILASEE